MPLAPAQTPCQGVKLRADLGNAVPVWLGASDVIVGSGFALYPGDLIDVPIDDVAKLYAIASVADQALDWLAWT